MGPYRLLLREHQPMPPEVVEQWEIPGKYDGYLKGSKGGQKNYPGGVKPITAEFDDDGGPGLSGEIREKLPQVRHRSLGQAARISGVTAGAVAVLMVYLKRTGSLKGRES